MKAPPCPGLAIRARTGPPTWAYKRTLPEPASAGLCRDIGQAVLKRYFLCKLDFPVKQNHAAFTGETGSRGCDPHSALSRKACFVPAGSR